VFPFAVLDQRVDIVELRLALRAGVRRLLPFGLPFDDVRERLGEVPREALLLAEIREVLLLLRDVVDPGLALAEIDEVDQLVVPAGSPAAW